MPSTNEIDYDTLCARCGQRYGAHYGFKEIFCPKPDGNGADTSKTWLDSGSKAVKPKVIKEFQIGHWYGCIKPNEADHGQDLRHGNMREMLDGKPRKVTAGGGTEAQFDNNDIAWSWGTSLSRGCWEEVPSPVITAKGNEMNTPIQASERRLYIDGRVIDVTKLELSFAGDVLWMGSPKISKRKQIRKRLLHLL